MSLQEKIAPAQSDTTKPANELVDAYHVSIEQSDISYDHHQLKIIQELQSVYNNLVNYNIKNSKNYFTDFFKNSKTNNKKRIGLYIWGGVGRGKTYLVDLFFNLVPIEKKTRLHFHRFMQLVHEELSALEGISDPLDIVAKNIAKKTQLLCLDELHVIDITDAMLLGKLFEALFELDVVLVTTSNFHPDDLYKNGLQRQRFLPAIQLIKNYTTIIEMKGDLDYRSRALEEIGIYYLSSSINTEHLLEEHFHRLSGVNLQKDRTDVIINGRKIPVKMWNTEVAWFSFDALCNSHRSTEDYTQIAMFFHTIIISNIPMMDSNMDDAARRFINMIDTFYDMQVNIVVSADAEPERLYRGSRLTFEFKRTISRINEMQTQEYITTVKAVD